MVKKLTWRDIARAILSGLDTVTFSVSAGVREVLVDRLDRIDDEEWKERVEGLMKKMDERLKSVQSEDRLTLLASLATTIPQGALAKMIHRAKEIQDAPDHGDASSLDDFWREFLASIKPENLVEKSDIVPYREQVIQGMPLSPKVLALLDPDRAACERANLPYRSAHMLHGLVASENGFAAKAFDAGDPALASEVRKMLDAFIKEKQPDQDRGKTYEAFTWDEQPIIQEAKKLAFLDAYPVVNEKYVFLALLDSKAGTIGGLRRFVGERYGAEALNRVREYVVTHAPAVTEIGGTGPVFEE
jgi:hypothetical protein